ncbi:MAG: radical SAM protein [Candidatus Omnitrophota bacterium]
MKTLFIAPSIKHSASADFPDGIPRSISRNFGIYPWIGICSIASYLRQHNFESDILDIDAEGLSLRGVIRRIRESNPQLIGISTISFTFLYALRLAREIKKHFDCPIVMGGPHVSIYPREVMTHGCIDVGVIGEGEQTFLELATAFAGNSGNEDAIHKEFSRIDGIAFRSNAKTVVTAPRKLFDNIDELPFPAIEKLKIQRYYGCNIGRPYITMVTARGCPFSCSFCSKQHWGDSFRFLSARRVVDEIEYYIKHLGIRAVDFYDDTFTIPRSRILEITDLVKKRNLKFDFGMMTRVDCVDAELITALKEAGCRSLAYGVEFGDADIQKKVDKEFSFAEIDGAFRLARQAGLATVGFFMVGHPEESEDAVGNTIRLIKQLDVGYVKANILIPYPGSKLYLQQLRSGNLKVDFWSELTRGKILPLASLIKTKISIPRLIELRNYINRLPYLKFKRNSISKIQKIKLFQDIKRAFSILTGSYLDRRV